MSDFDRNIASARGYGADRAVAIDAGLRAYMIRVYNTMALGVALTGLAQVVLAAAPAVPGGPVSADRPSFDSVFRRRATIDLHHRERFASFRVKIQFRCEPDHWKRHREGIVSAHYHNSGLLYPA